MADLQNIITLGIGSAPGNIRYFVLLGLDVNPEPSVLVALTLTSRDKDLALDERGLGLALLTRDLSMTLRTKND